MKKEIINYTLLDYLFDPAIVLDSKGKIVYYNHIFATLTKTSPRILKKSPNVFDILNDEKGELKRIVKSCVGLDSTSISEETIVKLTASPEVEFNFVIKTFELPSTEILVLFHDLSDEKNLHDKYRSKVIELQESHKQIVVADKLKSMADLSAGITHEIVTPLSIARGNIELVEGMLQTHFPVEEHPLIPRALKQLEKSIAKLDTINAIVNNMRTFANDDESKHEYCNLHKLLQEVTEMLKPKKEMNIRTMIDSGNATYITVINKIEIEQVVINIIKNAYDAIGSNTEKVGVVNISLKKDKEKQQFLIDIEDNGPGIKDDVKDKVFDSFFTTKDLHKGSGLGLAISKRLIEKHQGSIEVGDSLLGGAKFTIRLPKSEISSISLDREFLSSFVDANKIKILVIDDEVEILNLLSQHIHDMGHIIIGSTHPSDALDILEKFDIDLILTDYHMPQLNGTQFVKKLRSKSYETKVIYMSSQDNIKHFEEDKESLKISSFIEKPFSFDDIKSTIDNVISEK